MVAFLLTLRTHPHPELSLADPQFLKSHHGAFPLSRPALGCVTVEIAEGTGGAVEGVRQVQKEGSWNCTYC